MRGVFAIYHQLSKGERFWLSNALYIALQWIHFWQNDADLPLKTEEIFPVLIH